MDIDFQKYADQAVDAVVTFAPNLLMAIAVYYIGNWAIKKVSKVLTFALEKAKVSEDAIPFLSSFMTTMMKVFLIMSVVGILGIKMTALMGILAAMSFAVGMSLQGSLGNFAAGILILFFKPYRLGQWVEVDGAFGKIEEIRIFNTILITPGNKKLIIPNGKVVEGIITNYSDKGYIRVDLEVSMPYAESFPKVKQVILDAVKDVPGVLPTPAVEVGINTFDSHNILLAVRPYAEPDDFWDVKFECNQRIKHALSEHHVKMAYSEGVELGEIGE
ncbi:MAG TPA: mechanosensitive ion channel [Saprospiraceae bacterium]|nr:mechanosensitive ion channel [Saprospiraceae bacterium]